MLTIYRHCNNGSEFKASVSKLAKKLGIRMVHSRAYHPQTQGTVEVANRIFKQQLTALQTTKGCSD